MMTNLYTETELAAIQGQACSRTISFDPETQILPELFCQPIDIATELTGDSTQDIANMTDYPRRSVENAIRHIDDILASGISKVMLRIDSPVGMSVDHVLDAQYEALHQIRSRFSSADLNIILDPFSVALNSDKTWGIKVDDKLDYLATANLFARLSARFAEDADYILTLGRFEKEVQVTRRSLDSTKSSARVASFSTNTETTNAYVYSDHGAYSQTGQKIHVANAHEMIFRAIVDIHEGSELVIIKPAENLHILERLKTLMNVPALLDSFLASDRTAQLAASSEYLQSVIDELKQNPEALQHKIAGVSLGAYTVSGTYFIDKQSHARKGDDFMASLLHERFSNIAGVLSERDLPGLIIDRNAHWFANYTRNNQ